MRDDKPLLTEFGDKSKSAILALRWPQNGRCGARRRSQTLDAVLPAAVLRQLVPLVVQDRRERPTLMDAAADALLVQALAALLAIT
jgi:hypothetical protein